jgi:hypothetical protein
MLIYCTTKQPAVVDVLNLNPLIHVSIRRALVRNKLLECHGLIARVAYINLNDDRDYFAWSLNKNDSFSVRSMYKCLFNNDVNIMQEI